MPNSSRNQRLFASRDLTEGLSFRATLAAALTPEIAKNGTPTFARSTVGNYVNSASGLSLAAIDSPRFDWSSGAPGLLIEPTGTNLLLQSQALNLSPWVNGDTPPVITADATDAPDGSVTAERLDNPGISSRRLQATTLGTGVVVTASLFWKNASDNPATQSRLLMRYAQSTMELIIYGENPPRVAPGLSNYLRYGKQDFRNGWIRAWVTYVTNEANQYYQLYPDKLNLGHSCYYWGTQFETTPYVTSYVPSTTATASRGADKLSYSSDGNIDYRGWTISLWFRPVWDGADGGTRVLFDAASAGDRNRLVLQKDGDNMLKVRLYGDNAGAYRGLSSSVSGLADKWHNVTAWGDRSGAQGMSLDGFNVGSTDNSGAWSDAAQLGSTIHLGSDLNQANQAWAILSRASIWNRPRPEISRTIYSRGF